MSILLPKNFYHPHKKHNKKKIQEANFEFIRFQTNLSILHTHEIYGYLWWSDKREIPRIVSNSTVRVID